MDGLELNVKLELKFGINITCSWFKYWLELIDYHVLELSVSCHLNLEVDKYQEISFQRFDIIQIIYSLISKNFHDIQEFIDFYLAYIDLLIHLLSSYLLSFIHK